MKRFVALLIGLSLLLVIVIGITTRQREKRELLDAQQQEDLGHIESVRRALEATHPPPNIPAESVHTAGEEPPKLTLEQVEAYLLKTKRRPESLINAFTETGDTNYLAEAALRYPTNAIVQWTMAFNSSPAERAKWLSALKASCPENGLPNYLSALDCLKAGKQDEAIAEFDVASGKKTSAFELEQSQSREEMYLLSGYSPLEAKEMSYRTLGLSQFPELKQISWQIDILQEEYKAEGDTQSYTELAKIGIEAARKFSANTASPFITQMVGFAMEDVTLSQLEADTYYDFLGKTAGERLGEVRAQNRQERALFREFPTLYSQLSEAEKTIYWDRCVVYGELNAMHWLKDTYGTGN